jgi:hypothetical protein
VKTLALALPEGVVVSTAKVHLGKTDFNAVMNIVNTRAFIIFADPIQITPETDLHVTLV